MSRGPTKGVFIYVFFYSCKGVNFTSRLQWTISEDLWTMSQTATAERCYIFKLAPEIRLMIYKQLFAILTTDPESLGTGKESDEEIKWLTAILYTCTTFLDEAADAFLHSRSGLRDTITRRYRYKISVVFKKYHRSPLSGFLMRMELDEIKREEEWERRKINLTATLIRSIRRGDLQVCTSKHLFWRRSHGIF